MNGTQLVFTDDEAALYDRQIRLWGVDAQKRLHSTKVLIIGLSSIGAEVAKNIILGGVKSVTLLDPAVVTEADVGAGQFLLGGGDAIGKNRATSSLPSAQRLNPMVQVTAESCKLEEKEDSFFTQFTVIIVTNCTKTEIMRLNRIARESGIKFLVSDVFGFFGWIFLDLGRHEFKSEIITIGGKDPVVVDGVSRYSPFQDLISIDWNVEQFGDLKKGKSDQVFGLLVLLEFMQQQNRKPDPGKRAQDLALLLKLRDEFVKKNGLSEERIPDEFFETTFGEVGPTAAITGGVLAQEMVKAVSGKDEPIKNLFVCNPLTFGTGYAINLAKLV